MSLVTQVNRYTFKEGNSVNMFLPPFRNCRYSKRHEFAPVRSKFFPFRLALFLDGAWYAGKQIKSQKLSPLSEMVKFIKCI